MVDINKQEELFVRIKNVNAKGRWQKKFKLTCTEDWFYNHIDSFCNDYINNQAMGIEKYGVFDWSSCSTDNIEEWSSYEIESREDWLECLNIFKKGLQIYKFIK